jgi:ketosteroid isomerase-like protein
VNGPRPRAAAPAGEIVSAPMRDVVVTRVASKGFRPRNAQERLMIRFPSLYRRLARRLFRLEPRSRLRRLLVRRAVDSGWTSFDRRDFELNFLFFAPDTEFEFPAAMQALGIPASFRGHEGRVEGMNKIFEVWGSELEPVYVLDLGDRLLNLGLWRLRGRGSGIPLDQQLAQLVTVRDGLVVRDQNFTSWDEGLRAAGLEPEAVTLPAPKKTRSTADDVF